MKGQSTKIDIMEDVDFPKAELVLMTKSGHFVRFVSEFRFLKFRFGGFCLVLSGIDVLERAS